MSYGSLERIARSNKMEEQGNGYIIRRASIDRVALKRATMQVETEGQRMAVGGPWWEKADVRKLSPAPDGWPVDW